MRRPILLRSQRVQARPKTRAQSHAAPHRLEESTRHGRSRIARHAPGARRGYPRFVALERLQGRSPRLERALFGALAIAIGAAAVWQLGVRETATSSDAGPVHVHGLGINPADRALFIATHTGLFRVGEGVSEAKRV